MTTIQINHIDIDLPSSLSEITLGRWIEFYQDHGQTLDEMLKSILEFKDDVDKQIELSEFALEKMFRIFSFFTGVDLEVLRTSDFVDSIAEIYLSTLAPLFEQFSSFENMELKTEFIWNGETWVLPFPELKQGSDMTFGEFIDSKQRMQDMIEEGISVPERLLPMCAIFLRKKGEAYKEEFLYENSDRLQLMENLPMDIAMQVAFFFNFSTITSANTFPYSGHRKQRVLESFRRSILKTGAGSIFLKASPRQKFLTCRGPLVIRSNVQEWPDALMFWSMPVRTRNSQRRSIWIMNPINQNRNESAFNLFGSVL